MWRREDGLNSNSSVAGIGSDWFEGALVRPDLVLSDMARALNSSAVPQVCGPHDLRELTVWFVPAWQQSLCLCYRFSLT